MLTLNIFETIFNELIAFLKDIQYFFINIINQLHKFLNQFMPDEIILIFGILILAFIAIAFFRYVINKR